VAEGNPHSRNDATTQRRNDNQDQGNKGTVSFLQINRQGYPGAGEKMSKPLAIALLILVIIVAGILAYTQSSLLM
jgi:hypothetical protein